MPNGSEEVSKAFLLPRFPTLGERLASEARRIASCRIPVFPWLQPLETTIEHLASLPVPAHERFQRIEALPRHASLPGTGVAHGIGVASSPGVVSTFRPSASHADVPSRPGATSVPRSFGREEQPFLPRGQQIPLHLQQRLQNFVGQSTESIRIHNDAESHALAEAQRADAVTIGQHIFFREGQYRPQEARGFALLTHEALHVVRAMQPGGAWYRATQAGVQEEEQEAASVESRALEARCNASWEPAPLPPRPRFPAQASLPSRRPSSPSRTTGHASLAAESAAPTSISVLASTPAQRPMKASKDRSLDNVPALPDMEALKRSLYRDLMRQIKADTERGG